MSFKTMDDGQVLRYVVSLKPVGPLFFSNSYVYARLMFLRLDGHVKSSYSILFFPPKRDDSL